MGRCSSSSTRIKGGIFPQQKHPVLSGFLSALLLGIYFLDKNSCIHSIDPLAVYSDFTFIIPKGKSFVNETGKNPAIDGVQLLLKTDTKHKGSIKGSTKGTEVFVS